MTSPALTAYSWLLSDVMKARFTPLVSRLLEVQSRLLFAAGRNVAACRALAASSRMSNSELVDGVVTHLGDFKRAIPSLVSPGVNRDVARGRSIVLRRPGRSAKSRWKGILVIKFTVTSAYYFYNIDFRRLTRDYHVVLEPS